MYNSATNKFLSEEEYNNRKEAEKSEDILMLQAQFDDNGYADRYWFIDEKMATLLK
ncbi:hypothetical protein D3C86_2139960 [compost metagenome]